MGADGNQGGRGKGTGINLHLFSKIARSLVGSG